MCTGWCPLAVDWGNVAEIVAAIAACAVGWAVWRVSVRTNELAAETNKLARSANETNQKLAALEVQRETENLHLRERERILILVSLARGVGVSQIVLRTVDQQLQDSRFRARLAVEITDINILIENFEKGQFVIPESTRSRMHFIDNKLAATIFRAESAIPIFIGNLRAISAATPEVAKNGIEILAREITIAGKEAADTFNQCQEAARLAGIDALDLPARN